MTSLRAHYQNPVTDPEMWQASIVTYHAELGNSPPENLRKAFDAAWRKHPDWMPSCGQLAELVVGGGIDAKSRAAEAWPEVIKLATRSSGDHSDPIAAAAIRRMGGGRALGQMKRADLERHGRRDFEAHYVDIAAQPQDLEALPSAERKALS